MQNPEHIYIKKLFIQLYLVILYFYCLNPILGIIWIVYGRSKRKGNSHNRQRILETAGGRVSRQMKHKQPDKRLQCPKVAKRGQRAASPKMARTDEPWLAVSHVSVAVGAMLQLRVTKLIYDREAQFRRHFG